jgi:hypothetical protein
MVAALKGKTETRSPDTVRLVSFEPSHSWIKRHDSEGTLMIQAGYRVNPVGMFLKNDENPLVVYAGSRRWYGAIACQGQHESPLNVRKTDTSFLEGSFAAALRPTDHGKDLVVVVSHWDLDESEKMAKFLEGRQFDVTRNGTVIQCKVVKAIAELEGRGSYYLVRGQLRPGSSLLVEMGYGTAEEWVIDQDGNFSGKASDTLSVGKLAEKIANDPTVRSQLMGIAEAAVNQELISKALRSGTLGKMDAQTWSLVKTKYVTAWVESVKAYIRKTYAAELQTVSNVILTGGGAALLKDRLPAAFLIPDSPETASVRGCYQHYLSLVGGALDAQI